MSDQPTPFSVPFDLGSVSDAGADVILSPSAAEREAIAQWLEILTLTGLTATVRLTRAGTGEYRLAASFAADVVQACVVTLEPVPAHVTGEFHRSYQLLPRLKRGQERAPVRSAETVELTSLDDDETEIIENSIIDLAAPLLEEVSLALEPYPRAPGVEFEAPQDEISPADNPFAVLEKLRSGGAQSATPGSGKKRS